MIKLKFWGLGGQGVAMAAKIFSTAYSLGEGGYAITIPSDGYERRGAPVNVSIAADSVPVRENCFVYEPDVVLVTDASVIGKGADIADGIKNTSVLVLNADSLRTIESYSRLGFREIYSVDATGIAAGHTGRSIPNSPMLGALARTGHVGIDAIEKAILDTLAYKASPNALSAREAFHSTQITQFSVQAPTPKSTFASYRKTAAPAEGLQPLYGPAATVFTAARTGIWRLERPLVQYSACTLCGTCKRYCPCDIITVDKSSRTCVTFDFDYCKGCGICANECPANCISMVKEGGSDGVYDARR